MIANLLLAPFLTVAAPTDPTFDKDVAPLLWKHCAGCHRAGEIGPMPLMTYKDAAKRADFLAEVVGARQMPPWKAEPGYGKFRDEHRLSEAEIKVFADWAKAGAPEGDAKDLPAQPKFPEGWILGEPDLVLEMPKAFTVHSSGKDVQQCFVIPIPLDADKTIAAVEFRAGNRKIVHHAIMYLDDKGQAKKKDTGNGYSAFGGPGILPSGSLGAWAPGAGAASLPEGVGRYLKKGTDMVLQIHYHPSGKEETDRSKVGLYYTKKPAEKIIGGIGVTSRSLAIPAGEAKYRLSADSEPLPVDVKVIAVAPHMHYIGREMKAYAETPEGKIIPLIWIKDWDFNWQGSYILAEPLAIPKGSRIKTESVYDNSEANPKNPNKPPKPVKRGEQTNDEMCLFGVVVITDAPGGLREIARMRRNFTGVLFGGALTDADKPTELAYKDMPLPDNIMKLLEGYDKNKDGVLSPEEIEAMPPILRDRLKELIGKKK